MSGTGIDNKASKLHLLYPPVENPKGEMGDLSKSEKLGKPLPIPAFLGVEVVVLVAVPLPVVAVVVGATVAVGVMVGVVVSVMY